MKFSLVNKGLSPLNQIIKDGFKVTVKYSGVAKRKDGEVSIELSDNWNFEDTHIWIYLTSSDRQINSDSICVK